jgi:hypothetical protein
VSKKVALIGHCGPDSSYLRMTISKAAKDVKILSADDDAELNHVLGEGPDLLLFNRQLGYGFSETQGVKVIEKLHGKLPIKMMLISNHHDAQEAAVAAGALPGFGKREIGTPKVLELLREALKD